MAEGNDDKVKVTDKRLFTEEGDLRGELPPEEAEEKEAAPPQQEEPSGFERKPMDEPEGVDFMFLINAMAQPALIHLGEVPHPGTGQAEINLEQARLQIDMLDVLRIKSRGNLTEEEEKLLDHILYELRMRFVKRSNQPEKE